MWDECYLRFADNGDNALWIDLDLYLGQLEIGADLYGEGLSSPI